MNAHMPKSRRSLNVACALDLNIWKQVAKSKPLGEPARCHLEVVRALKRLYRTVHLVPLGDDLARLLNAFKELKPDVVFNLALSACDLQPSFAGFLDFVGIPYTGSAPLGIALATDKIRSRELLRAAGLRVPRFVGLPIGASNIPLDLTPPVIVKPARLGGSSYGIYRDSLVMTPAAALACARRIWERLGLPAVCDEFVRGRELRIGVIEDQGRSRFRITGISECHFPGVTPGWGFKNEGVRINSRVRKARGVWSSIAKLPKSVIADLAAIAESAMRVLDVRGYGTLDVRMDNFGRITVLEVNPNPGLTRRSKPWQRPSFAYNISCIVRAALAR